MKRQSQRKMGDKDSLSQVTGNNGRFRAKNMLWTTRKKHGRNSKFPSAIKLQSECYKYFEWVEDNPYYEDTIAGTYKNEVVMVKLPKVRPMTITGLCLFLKISYPTWRTYKTKSTDFSIVCETIEAIIWDYKFAGAAVGIFKPCIVAKELSARGSSALNQMK